MDPGADKPGSLVLDGDAVFFKVLPGSAQINEEESHVQLRADVLPGDDGLLQGRHTAEIGTVRVSPFLMAAHADAMDPGDLLGLFAVRAPLHVAVGGAAGAQETLKLQAGINVGIFTVTVSGEMAGVKGLEARGQDHRSHVNVQLLGFHVMNNGLGLTDLDALLAFGANAAVDATLRFRHRFFFT